MTRLRFQTEIHRPLPEVYRLARQVERHPEFIADYNKGPSDWDTPHNWVTNVIWDVPSPGVAATG